MFRRGGSAAKGTGITSGLERQGYKTGMFVQPGISQETIKERMGNKYDPDGSMMLSQSNTITGITEDLTKKPLEAINERAMQAQQKQSAPQTPRTPGELEQQLQVINQMKERFQPTTGDVIDDTMAAIASTAPDDPTKLQTFGQFLSKAGAGATGLRRQRQEAVDKFEKDATLQVLKNLNKDEKDQLFRYANERARLLNIPPEKRTTQDKQRLQFLERYLKGVPRKGIDFQARQLELSDRLTKPRSGGGSYGYSKSQADNIAKVQIAIEQSNGKIPPANYGPKDGNYEGKNPGRYIDADTATIILWDGKNK